MHPRLRYGFFDSFNIYGGKKDRSVKVLIISPYYHRTTSKAQEPDGITGSVALSGFQINDDFAEVPGALHESISFLHLIELEYTVYYRMNVICF
jgi:hypothetical protein